MKIHLVLSIVFCISALSFGEAKSKKRDVVPPPVDERLSRDPDILEVLPAQQFVQFSEMDPIPEDVIQWDKRHLDFVYISKNQRPYIYLSGTLGEGLELFLNEQPVPLVDRKFEQRISLAPEPRSFTLRILNTTEQTSQNYRLVYSWMKIPPSLRIRVKESDTGVVVEKSTGFSGQLKRSAFTQLYSGGEAVQTVDLDSQRRAKLSFRITYPREAEESYDGWSLVVKDSDKKPVAEIKRYGSPPLYVDWGEIWTQIASIGTYTYQVNLYKEDQVYEGVESKFETTAGRSVVRSNHAPAVSVEPRQEFGYLTVKTNASYTFSNVYALTDVPVTIQQLVLLRASGMLSLPNITPTDSFTFTRLGAGVRLYGSGSDSIWGETYLYRLDVYLSHTAYTTFQADRFTQINLLLEPHLVLWQKHYFVPHIEAGLGTGSMKLAAGLAYQFFIRPWSLKMGMGVAYDGLVKNDSNPSAKFNAFRFLTSFTFLL